MDDRGRDAVRHSYDAVAEAYLAQLGDELEHKPLDRALLQMVLERRDANRLVADIGCGPGHVAGWLAERGATVVGIDLSPEMVALGSRHFPAVEFRQGDLLVLPAADGEFGVVVALYCLIHLAPEELGPAASELHRVLAPGGVLLVSFHLGSEVRHRSEWFGQQVDVDFRFYELDQVSVPLEAAGLVVDVRLERAPYPEEAETRRGYLLARRPA